MTPRENELPILLVEDNPGDANLVRHHLERGAVPTLDGDIQLTHVEDLRMATDRLDKDEFALVLLDLGLPESTELETLDRIVPHVDDTPIVVLTKFDDTETALEAINHGAQDYLPKDELDQESLMRAVRYAIQRERRSRELRRRTEQLEFFNSILRHDVQNGMDVIRRNAQLLEEDLMGENKERAETIVDWSNDIIDLSRSVRRMLDVMAHEDEISLQPVDLTSILHDQIKSVEGMRDTVSVERNIQDNLAVYADEMLGEVINNILTNSVEHNDTDEIEIEVEATENEDEITVKIADNGPGIAETDREKVLWQGERGESSEGSGFGLYFVSTMVESYGGSIGIADNEPRGTVFTVNLAAV